MPAETVRAFFAVFPPEDVAADLDAYVGALRRDLRDVSWVKAGNLHLTLRFFGDLMPEQVEAAAAAAREAAAAHAPFRLRFGDPGAFPTLQEPRVIWLGIEAGRARLVGLAADLERALTKAGLGHADKPFAPHLTLGRVRDHLPAAALPALFRRHPAPRFEFPVGRLALMKSELNPRGSIYTELAGAALTSTA